MNTEMKELEKIAPELSKIKKENPFRVPENYFDDFSARLQVKLDAEQNAVPVKKNNIIRYLKPAIGLAAGFALVFSLAYWPLKTLTPNQTAESDVQEISVSDMLFASAVEGIDVNSFYELLEKPAENEQLSDEDLANYVNTNVSEYEIYSQAATQ
ncbi:MAG TPA: hypothetical protein DER09_10510 [Prolixibacteraceae bacterium]|nr:hypothetical protein [Prolixibacteraceae bacterium]